MNRNDWKEEIRSKMEDYSPVEIEGVWEAIESKMDAAAPSRVIPWKLIIPSFSAVAAAMLALVLLNRPTPDSGFAVSDGPKDYMTMASEDMVQETLAQETMIPAVESIYIVPSGESREFDSEHVAPTVQAEAEIPSEDIQEKFDDSSSSTENHVSEEDAMGSEKLNERINEDFAGYFEEDKVVRSRRIALSANGGFSMGESKGRSIGSNPVFADALLNSFPTRQNEIAMSKSSEMSWHVAASASVMAQMYLNGRLSLSSGIAWTLLMGTDDFALNQLYIGYLGIPLRVGYDFLRRPQFDLKVSAGVKGDICINKPRTVESGRFQYSAYAGINATYMFSRHIGLNAGVGTDVYFPFKDAGKSPFNTLTQVADLSLGLVWRIK